MKKKESILVVIMGIITVAVIFMGFTYNKNRKEELLNNNNYEAQSQSDSFNERKQNAEEKKKAEFLGAFEKKRNTTTVADFMQYVAYNKKDTTVSFYGAIETDAAWAVQTMDTIAQERNLKDLEKHFIPAESLEAEEKMELLTNGNPDVVFFAIPDKGDVEVAEAALEVFKTYDAIKTALPESLVVVLAPTPIVEKNEVEKEVALHQAYVDEIVKVASKNKVALFNLHNDLMENATTTNIPVTTIYNEQDQLNETGIQMLKDVFLSNLKEVTVDTSKAYHAKGKRAKAESIVPEEESSSEELIVEESIEEVISEESIEEIIIEEESSEEPVEWVEPESSEVPVWEEPVYEQPESTWTPPVTKPTPPPAPPVITPPKPEPEPSKPVDPPKPADPPESVESESNPESESDNSNYESEYSNQ